MRGGGEEKGGWESEGMVERRGGGEGREEKRKGVRAEGVRKVRYLSNMRVSVSLSALGSRLSV